MPLSPAVEGFGWWIDEGRLLGGRNPSTSELRMLARRAFAILVCLLDHDDGESPDYDPNAVAALGFARHCIEVPDFSVPTLSQLDRFVRIVGVDKAEAKVLVHCQGGCGRSGTFGAAYWIAHGLPASAAIARVRKANRYAVETSGQETVLKQYAVYVGGR